MIGNLTTVTSSLNNFAVALLGFKWANELCAHLPAGERQSQIRETFLRYEQLTGYLRYMSGNTALMGITRVAKRIQDPSFSISLGLHADEMILIDQASYGMWGLYSSAMRDTGLVRGGERSLTPLGDQLALAIEAKLDKHALLDLTRKGGDLHHDVLQKHAKRFLRAIQNRSIQSNLVEALMGGSEANLIQQELWQLTRSLREKDKLKVAVPEFIDTIKNKTRNPQLKARLIEIEQIERLLVAANNLFHYCRRKDGEKRKDILTALAGINYNYAHLAESQSLSNLPHAQTLEGIRVSLIRGNNRQALIHIFELNKRVMEQRGGAPWVELEPNQKLRVRVPSETSELLTQKQLITSWNYEYFFTSYLSIAHQAPLPT